MGNSGHKETEIVSSDPPVRYRRGKSESGTSPEARAIVEEIFAREPNRSVVSVSWVQRSILLYSLFILATTPRFEKLIFPFSNRGLFETESVPYRNVKQTYGTTPPSPHKSP